MRRSYGVVGLLGIGVSVLILLALHFLDTDISVVSDYMSLYALGNYSSLRAASNVATGVGTVAVALGLRDLLAPSRKVAIAWSLMLIGGLSFVALAFVTTDPPGAAEQTVTGLVHNGAGYVQLLSFLVAAWLLPAVFARDESFEHLAPTQLWFARLITASLLFILVSFNGPIGLAQRLFAVLLFGWLLVVARRLSRGKSALDTSLAEGT